MLQLMRSSDGGFTHAYDEGEITRLIGLGWKRAEPAEQKKVETIVVASVAEAEQIAAPRRGRPPKA